MSPDSDLLRQFAGHGDQAAFAELVRRHADFVYSVALRVTCNSALAQDVTQAVFTTMARQAGKLCHYETLLGWLHTTTRHIAINTVRGEARRRAREHEATAMQNINSAPETNWAEISPLLDEAVGSLREPDREAVLLRFFKNLSHQEIGAALGLGEDAARKRVDRALEKLREHFARRGVTASSALLATAIAENSVQAAPVGLVASVTSGSSAGIGSLAASGAILTTIYMTTKTKTILAAVVILAIVATLAVRLQSKPEQPNSAPMAEATKTTTRAPAAVSPPVILPVPAHTGSPAMSAGTQLSIAVAPDPAQLSAAVVPDVSLAEPTADLKTTIPELIQVLKAGDYVSLIKFVRRPDEVDQDLKTAGSLEKIGEIMRQNLAANGGPDTLALGLQKILDQNMAPALDATGRKAVYSFDTSAGTAYIVFTKKQGVWYFTGGSPPGQEPNSP